MAQSAPDESGRFRTRPQRGKIIEHAHELAQERLISELKALRQGAGNPSLGELVQLSQQKLSKSTLDDHLSGRRRRLPPWRFVAAYVSACHAAAASTGLNVARLGTLDGWHLLWDAALKGDAEAPSPLDDGQTLVLGSSPLPKSDKAPDWPAAMNLRENDIRTYSDSSITPIIQQFENELSDLAKSLPPYAGLLIIAEGPTFGKRFPVERNITTIGRDPESDVWLNDPAVSRRHAVIRRYGERFFVVDSESTNGTYRQQSLVKGESVLDSHEELQIGPFSLLFISGGSVSDSSLRESHLAIRARLARDLAISTPRVGSPYDYFSKRPR